MSAEPHPETMAIYKHDQPFLSAAESSLIGRPFHYEYLPGTFVLQTGNSAFTYTIPGPDGQPYTLAEGQALFVETVTEPGAAWYAVLPWGTTDVIPGVNRTSMAVNTVYDPINEPVTCHLQLSQKLPGGYTSNWFALWQLGRQDENAGRPDFPVMANAYKNGTPAMFIVSEAIGMDTTNGQTIPATHWFHGGGGEAANYLPFKSKQFNIAPQQGILVAHNDDFPHLVMMDGNPVFSASRTAWFGYVRNYDPFQADFMAGPGDTVINYTQRRILWIGKWLVDHYRVDPHRIAIQGYSMGSGGVGALAKTFPQLFSTVCSFNNGYRRVNEETLTQFQGTVENNLPTNLIGPDGLPVKMNSVMDLNTPISPFRDWPIYRVWAGKQDINDRMHWGPDLVSQYRMADSIGQGIQISWDERLHTYPVLNQHWIEGEAADQQTLLDDVATQELFRSNESFPAFFHHQQDAQNRDPGIGMQGIDTGDGDNWGTWGGYHRWDLLDVTDQPDSWAITAWLAGNAAFANDNCPVLSLTSDMAIRRPQNFTPASGTMVHWSVTDISMGSILQSGNSIVHPNGLVVLPQVTLFRDDIRRVRIEVQTMMSAVDSETGASSITGVVWPNPAHTQADLRIVSSRSGSGILQITDLAGSVVRSKEWSIQSGEQSIPLDIGGLLAGWYMVRMIQSESSSVWPLMLVN